MNGTEARGICVAACDGALENIQEDRKKPSKERKNLSVSKKGIREKKVYSKYATVTTYDRILDTDNLGVMVKDRVYYDNIDFTMVDQTTHRMSFRAPRDVLDAIDRADKKDVKLVSDMVFLIRRCKEFYGEYGNQIAYPPVPNVPMSNIVYPRRSTASPDQRKAVETMLTSPLSYVWGAPGTGKTQMVLSTAILAYIRSGKRVAVVAPTNNSVEQVLRGIFKMLQAEDPDEELVDVNSDVLRLGLATKEFIDDYPDVCEKKAIDEEIEQRKSELKAHEEALMERALDKAKADFRKVEGLCSQMLTADNSMKHRIRSRIDAILDVIRKAVATDSHLTTIMSQVDGFSISGKVLDLYDDLYGRERPALDFYEGKSTPDLESESNNIRKRIADLLPKSTASRTGSAKIVAMTPQVFMNRFYPKGGTPSKGMEFDFDHVFIDEVGYCGLMNALCFFTCGVPISLLGDHKQLPPVCDIDEEYIGESLKLPGTSPQHYLFMWNESALFAEDFISGSEQDAVDEYNKGVFSMRCEADLLESHRFGANLGDILDRLIYGNGIKGVATQPLAIESFDAVCPPRTGTRENTVEADRVADYLLAHTPDPKETAILTPYTDQLRHLKSVVPEDYAECVMTIHKSQGREWETVILSPADNLDTDKDHPLRFTSTTGADPECHGDKVINTAVSRAKSRLVVVCDENLWTSMKGELIGELVLEARRQRQGASP